MANIKLTLAYDGTGYKGWQKTNAGSSIEESLQKALETVFQHPVILQAASRTDAGVHAEAQVVNFFTSIAIESPPHLILRLNQLLPKDISILKCEIVDDDFHPTTKAKGKIYAYYVCLGPIQMPRHRHYSWHCYDVLDIGSMHKAAEFFEGTHDFSSFCNIHANSRYSHFDREVKSIDIQEIEGNRLCFIIEGRSFLYKMVRNLVGTMVNIGQGKLSLDQLPEIIAAKDRRKAGISAPAHGLFLKEVIYH